MSVEFSVLGHLVMTRAGEPVPLGTPQRRRVLATLLCQPNRRIAADLLVDSVWGDDPPRTAAKNLQVHIYHLRRALSEPDRIEHRLAGYLLRVGRDEVDAERFEHLVECGQRALQAGDPRAAEARFGAALALWRGPAFADLQVCGTRPFFGEALRLDELRLVAVEGRGEARLRTGRHHAVIADLAGTLAEHQFRERLAAQLMVALYRAGRQAEALEVFHRVRVALADTMGVDPGDHLVAVYRGILSGSDDLYGTGLPWRAGTLRAAASTLAS